MSTVVPDPLLAPNDQRFVLFPIKYPEVWKRYKQQVASFWTVEEINFDHDKKDFDTLTDDEQVFIKHILAFFAASDGIVVENLAEHFMTTIQVPEVRCFYGFQIMMENIHSETYSLLIDTYVTDPIEKDMLFNAVEHFPSIRGKAQWGINWIQNETSFAKILIAFAIIEGVFFSSSFCAIFWLKKRNKMHGLTFSNELISRDEGLHTDFACLMYSMMQEKVDEKSVHLMFKEAVDLECSFVDEAIPDGVLGMNASMMKQYVRFVADRLLFSLGFAKLYHTSNPFEWMEMISLQGKTNFFARRVSEYQKAGVHGGDTHEFTTDVDF